VKLHGRLEVRQAVQAAISRDRINDRVYAGLGVVAAALLPPGLLGYDAALRAPAYDPDRARTLLRKAGYADGFELQYRTWETDEFNNQGIVPLIVEDLAAVGIRVTVSRYSATEARQHLNKRGHGTLFCGNWYADFPDPDNFFFIFFHSLSTSLPGINYNRQEIDAKIERARRSNDVEERAAIYGELNQMVVREAPLVPLFHERVFVANKPHVRALRTSLVPPVVRFHEVWVEE
jgi:ABC-type transport system substrate-binding protein